MNTVQPTSQVAAATPVPAPISPTTPAPSSARLQDIAQTAGGFRFESNEVKSQGIVQDDIFRISVQTDLTRRKLYSYLFVSPANASLEYFAICRLRLMRTGNVVGEVPLSIGQSSGASSILRSSIACFGTNGGVATDNMMVTFASYNGSAGETPAAVIVPTNFNLNFDTAIFDVRSLQNITYVRAYVAIVSTGN